MINNLSTISSTFSTSYIQEPLQGSHHRIQHSKLLALFHRFHHHLLQCQRLAFPWILLLAADINLAIVEAHFFLLFLKVFRKKCRIYSHHQIHFFRYQYVTILNILSHLTFFSFQSWHLFPGLPLKIFELFDQLQSVIHIC